MSQLHEATEYLAAAALAADTNDLPALANLHEKLLSVASQGAGTTSEQIDQVKHKAHVAATLVEGVILREAKDAQAALDDVCRQIADIQALVTGQSVAAEPPASQHVAPPPHPPAPAVVAAQPATLSAEALPKAEDLPLVVDFLAEAREHLAAAEADFLKLEERPEDGELVNSIFRSFHTIKGVAGFLNLQQIGKLAHAAETLLDLGRKGELTISGGIADVILDALDMAKTLLAQLETAMNANHDIPANVQLPTLLRRLHAAAAGTAPACPPSPENAGGSVAPQAVAAPAPVAPAADEPAVAQRASAQETPTATTDATVKVSTSRLDALINMVGELVIAQAMVSQDMSKRVGEDQRVARNLSHLGKITRELQDLTMAMRMVPIHGVFQKMSRLVRDLSRKAGKELVLTIEGGETEVDRNLVESIADPLVHMIRNSADHGIEMPEDREKAGKPRAGQIKLKAYHQAGNIVVEITDDGRGLNKQRILAKARQAGLVREGQELSEEEIFKLIFAPGLSTAEKITDVSGRGVGMDVVRRNVEALRGRIDIASQEGKGSTIAIRLPLTLAVIDGLVIKVGGSRYILPITSIEQSLRPKASQLSTVQERGEVCMIRERLIPLVRLHTLFRVTPRTTDPCEALLVLVQDGARRCCLLVDELLGQQQVVIKSLGEATESIRGVSGGAILGDGTISLILDVPGLMDLATQSVGR